MKLLQRALLASAVLVAIAAAVTLQPFKVNAQSSPSRTLGALTVEDVRDLRDQTLKKRAAAQQARGAAFDQRSKNDVDRALHADTDLFFDEPSRNKARALREACLSHEWSACTELGQMYEAGEGTWADEHLAFAFYVTACFEKDIAACTAVSWNWRIDAASGRYEGHAPYSDVITESCEKGHADSCYRLSLALKYGGGTFSVNKIQAASMLERACALGSDEACHRQPKTPAEQATQRASECASGRQSSCFFFGERLISGNGIQTDEARGERLIRQSCDHGVGRACAWVVKNDALDTIAQANLLARGCEVRPGEICNDAARLFASLPDTPETIARFDQVRELACGAPGASCLRRFWIQVDRAVDKLDPFDPAADKRFADASSAGVLREKCASAVHDACHQLAKLYRQNSARDRFLLAAQVLRPSCEAGDGSSCLLIDALMPLDGRTQRAVYQQACDAGAVEGCLRLVLIDPEKTPAERLVPVRDTCSDGHMFACRMQAELLTDQAGRFEDGRADRARAEALFLFACENDDASACYRYAGILAQRSKSSNADDALIDKAMNYWERACFAGHADACGALGYEYEDELATGGPKNLDLSIHFHQRACALDPRSCEDLARVNVRKNRNALRREHGVLKSALMSHEADFKEEYRARVRRYRRDCEAGDMAQCINLGARYVDDLEVDGIYGLPLSTPRAWIWAFALYDLACGEGLAAGCEAFAAAHEHAGTRSNPETALSYSQKGCALGAAQGCYRLGDFYLRGEHIARDLAAAERLFRKACNFDMEDACKRLADREFTKANLPHPNDRLILACSHGDWSACSGLRDSLRQANIFKRNGDLIREVERIACDEGDDEMCRILGEPQND